MDIEYNLIYFDVTTYETVCIGKKNKSTRFKGKPSKLIDTWCLENGSSLNGRTSSFKYMLGIKQKPCILVNEHKRLMYLPTMSTESIDCHYIRLGCIEKIIKVDKRLTKIITKKGEELLLPFNHRVIQKQYHRSMIYLFKLKLVVTNSMSVQCECVL